MDSILEMKIFLQWLPFQTRRLGFIETNPVKLLILRENGQPHSVYNGPNLKNPFCSQGVCISCSGNIFVSKKGNVAIHLLNMDAIFVKIWIQVKLIGWPKSLTLKNDQLWVGTATGHIKVFQITNEWINMLITHSIDIFIYSQFTRY